MLRTRINQKRANSWGGTQPAPMRRPGAVMQADSYGMAVPAAGHSLCDAAENQRLFAYESRVKASFDAIVPALKRIAAQQNREDFESAAQAVARAELGFEIPGEILEAAWVGKLDMQRLYAWCVFETYRRYCDDFFSTDPLGSAGEDQFQGFLQSCGFHTLDVSPCADGRLAHVIRYVLRLPLRGVRRKSYAGAMFDIDNSTQKWVETEMLRHSQGKPNRPHEATRYLKTVVYHYSSVDPHHEGCAAHGSDTAKAASAGLERLHAFQTAVENSFCCGASIDILLIGLDTDTDAIRVHMPDAYGDIDVKRYVSSLDLYSQTSGMSADQATAAIEAALASSGADKGMVRLATRLVVSNLSQIEYVSQYHNGHYADIGHAERFIGTGIGFEEVQLRNLTYFAYLNTVEESVADLDVGIKIFTGLNVSRSLPVPVVVRFDYHGQVPGARERAIAHCERVAGALHERYEKLSEQGLLHTLMVVRDCESTDSIEVLGSSLGLGKKQEGH